MDKENEGVLNELKRNLQDIGNPKMYMDSMKLCPSSDEQVVEESLYETKFGTKYEFANSQLASIKEYFGKLKFNFLELESKEKFIKTLMDDLAVIPGTQEISVLEKAIGEKKKALKEFKDDIEMFQDNLKALVKEICDLRPIFDEKFDESRKELEDMEYMSMEIQTLKSNPMIADCRTVDECEAELEQQTRRLQHLLDEIELGKAHNKTLTNGIKQAQDIGANLQKEFLEIQEKVAGYKAEADQKDPEEQQKLLWYQTTANLMSEISGLQVTSYEPGKSIAFNQKTEKNQTSGYDVEIRMKGIKIVDIKVKQDNCEVGWSGWFDQIISFYNHMNVPLSGVISEVCYQLEIFDARNVELQDLASSAGVFQVKEHDNNPHMIDLTSNKFSVCVQVDRDYPMPGSKVSIVSVKGRVGGKQSTKRESIDIKSITEEHKPSTIFDIIMICDTIFP